MESPPDLGGSSLPEIMKALLLWILIGWSPASAEEALRVSRVVATSGEGIERMTFKSGDREEVLFVERKAVVSTADVQEAWAEILPSSRRISVRLKPEGAKKMAAVTGKMKLGVERLAVVVDGKPKAALVVQGKLGANFIIEGFDDLTDGQLKELARKSAGRPAVVPGVEKPAVRRPVGTRHP
jgi:preprotein translocase subunit SecD